MIAIHIGAIIKVHGSPNRTNPGLGFRRVEVSRSKVWAQRLSTNHGFLRKTPLKVFFCPIVDIRDPAWPQDTTAP